MKFECSRNSIAIQGVLTTILKCGLIAAPPGETETSLDEYFFSNAFGDTDEHQTEGPKGDKGDPGPPGPQGPIGQNGTEGPKGENATLDSLRLQIRDEIGKDVRVMDTVNSSVTCDSDEILTGGG